MQQLIEWRDSLSVGIEVIDNQHKKLIDILNRVYDGFLNSSFTVQEVRQVVKELLDYTNYHFSEEERMFEKFHYLQGEEHTGKHDFFVQRLAEMQQRIETDPSIQLELLLFLKDWLIEHIEQEDQKYARLFKQLNVV